jgi:tRNA(Ile)-lysidine synthetase-like protein
MDAVDWDRMTGTLALRNWTPGDRLRPAGAAGAKKIKELFQAARIPSWERGGWPVLAAGSAVVWTRRFGVAAEAAARPSSRLVLQIRERRLPPNLESESDGTASKE